MKNQPKPLETNPVLRQDPFVAPEGYFSDLAQAVHTRVAGQPVLQHLAQPSLRTHIFAVPVGYWSALPALVQARIAQLRSRAVSWWPQFTLHYAMPTLAGMLVVVVGYLNMAPAPQTQPTMEQAIYSELAEGMDAFDPTDTALLADQLAQLQQVPDMQWQEQADYLLNHADLDLIIDSYQ